MLWDVQRFADAKSMLHLCMQRFEAHCLQTVIFDLYRLAGTTRAPLGPWPCSTLIASSAVVLLKSKGCRHVSGAHRQSQWLAYHAQANPTIACHCGGWLADAPSSSPL